jgi:2-polyprenyl-3-methyl-5-hydroxy-6-metoxy-1,4-benzoquinol methylase
MTIDHARRTSFDRFAVEYDLARPSYPDAIALEIAARVTGRRAVEIGAGTGKATELMARHGFSVVAIEPGANLAAVLRARRLPGVTLVDSTFEAWSGADGTFDVVVAAQSIHWIQPEVRYAKTAAALRPGGAIACLRNEGASLDADLRAALDAAYARWFPESVHAPGDPIEQARHQYETEIAASGHFGLPHIAAVPWTQTYSSAQYLALLSTYSNHALLDPERRRGLDAAIAAAIDRRGVIEVPYVTLLLLAERLG